ncbi:hypothetical protein C8T65DRAFT_222992 [Cerioporus squamosus]|nr:hypothetical protein C8T65DRAFT_222992 [Cerioporus squamosus]
MSSYSSTSLSSYDPASSSHSELPSSPSTSPGTSPPSPLSLKHAPSFPPGPRHPRTRTQTHPLSPPPPLAPPAQRTRALTLDARPHGIGVDPSALVGKQLTRVRRSRTHPCITLHCADGSLFQVLVVGYDPHHRGVPKVLESDSPVLNPRSAAESAHADLRLTISHAASITLSDKAFQALPGPASGALKEGGLEGLAKAGKQREDRWTQRHAAFALKFEEEQGWHCVWATMAEYDERDRERCVFRNYADVYLDSLHAPSTPPAPPPPLPTARRMPTSVLGVPRPPTLLRIPKARVAAATVTARKDDGGTTRRGPAQARVPVLATAMAARRLRRAARRRHGGERSWTPPGRRWLRGATVSRQQRLNDRSRRLQSPGSWTGRSMIVTA